MFHTKLAGLRSIVTCLRTNFTRQVIMIRLIKMGIV